VCVWCLLDDDDERKVMLCRWGSRGLISTSRGNSSCSLVHSLDSEACHDCTSTRQPRPTAVLAICGNDDMYAEGVLPSPVTKTMTDWLLLDMGMSCRVMVL